MVLDKESGYIFNAYTAWDSYVFRNNLRNPFKEKEELFNECTTTIKNENGSTTLIIKDKTPEQLAREKDIKEYIDKFLVEREIWVGQYLLDKYGYDTLSYFAQTHSPTETAFFEWYRNVLPCEGKDGQCFIFCPNFHNCDKI